MNEAHTMVQESVYSREQIEEICEEVESQWEYHLIARAAFPSNMMEGIPEYESPPFYPQHGVRLQVRVPVPFSPVMERGLEGIGHWLNQNYIIRLFGILDEYRVITAGREASNPYTHILAILRHNVGTHSRGYRNPGRTEVRKVTRLIQEHLDPSVLDEDIRHFNLAIDTVLHRLKEHCVTFVRSLEGRLKPSRKSEDGKGAV
jgi:hypothetical protein